jgi:hypothetical protein
MKSVAVHWNSSISATGITCDPPDPSGDSDEVLLLLPLIMFLALGRGSALIGLAGQASLREISKSRIIYSDFRVVRTITSGRRRALSSEVRGVDAYLGRLLTICP